MFINMIERTSKQILTETVCVLRKTILNLEQSHCHLGIAWCT